jgi:biotin synthase
MGEMLLTAENPGEDKDAALFSKLGLSPMPLEQQADAHAEAV